MTKALIPALIASLFAGAGLSGAHAADRELLFGPGTGASQASSAAPDSQRRKAPDTPRGTGTRIPLFGTDEPQVRRQDNPAGANPAPVRRPAPRAEKPKTEARPARRPAAADAVREITSGLPRSQTPAPAVPQETTPRTPAGAVPAPAGVRPAPAGVPQAPSGAPSTPAARPAPASQGATQSLPAPAAAPAPAVTERMAPPEIGPATAFTRGSDPLSDRQAILRRMNAGSVLAVYPGSAGGADVYQVQRNTLPLANYLSARTGVVFSPVAERDLDSYRAHLANQDYPLAVIHTPLIDDALRSGYEVLAVSEHRVGAAVLVRSDSGIAQVSQLKGRTVAMMRDGETAPHALRMFAAQGLSGSLRIADIGQAGSAAALHTLMTGVADAAVISDAEAEAALKSPAGKLTRLAQSDRLPALAVVVRKGAYDDRLTEAIRSAVTALGRSGSRDEQAVLAALSRSTNLSAGFTAPAAEDLKAIQALTREAAEKWPDLAHAPGTETKSAGAQPGSGLYRLAKQGAQDSFVERGRLAAGMRDGTQIGFPPGAPSVSDSFTFARLYNPLANFLTRRSGGLVTLVPERNTAAYRARIAARDYSHVLVDGRLTGAAAEAGYTPLLRTRESHAHAVVVRADGPADLRSLEGRRVAWPLDDAAATMAYASFARQGVRPGAAAAVSHATAPADALRMLDGRADAVVMRLADAEKAASEARQPVRIIEKGSPYPALSLWVRRGEEDSAETRKLAAAFQAIDPADRSVAEAIAAAHRTAPEFVAARAEDFQQANAEISQLAARHAGYAEHGDIMRLLQGETAAPADLQRK